MNTTGLANTGDHDSVFIFVCLLVGMHVENRFVGTGPLNQSMIHATLRGKLAQVELHRTQVTKKAMLCK